MPRCDFRDSDDWGVPMKHHSTDTGAWRSTRIGNSIRKN